MREMNLWLRYLPAEASVATGSGREAGFRIWEYTCLDSCQDSCRGDERPF